MFPNSLDRISGLCALQAYDSSENDSSDDENHHQHQRNERLGLLGLGLAQNSNSDSDGDKLRPNVTESGTTTSTMPTPTRPRPTQTTSNRRSTSQYLPLPDEVMSMFDGDGDDVTAVDKSPGHQGRIRSFPHEVGNWATYVYVPINVTHELEDLISALIHCIPAEFKMQPLDMFHLSVSRTVMLKYHWIRPFVESVSNRLVSLPQFVCAFGKPHIYVNDEATRSFLSLTIGQGMKELQDIVKEVDLALNEFNLPPFYKPASFHVSLGWCLGDISKHLSTKLVCDLERCFLEHFSSKTSVWKVNNLCSKIGNKSFTFPLT